MWLLSRPCWHHYSQTALIIHFSPPTLLFFFLITPSKTWQRVPSVLPPTTTHLCFTLTPFHPPGNSSAAVSTLGLLGERYGFEVHMQGWMLVCMRCWVIVEAKCLIAHDRQSSGELRRTRLQNHNQALSHPKHQRGVGIILSGDVCPNKVFTPVKCMCVSVMLGNFFPLWNIQENLPASSKEICNQ